MVYVPPGPFVYGMESEANLRIAAIETGFWIDRYPVTNADYCDFLNKRGNKKEGGVEWLDESQSDINKLRERFVVSAGYEKHPVTGVSWYGATAYAASVRKRLPTEVGWEKAARGVDGRMYPWGDEFDARRCNTSESKYADTTVVGQFSGLGSSVYGCEDMAGNVWEWTATAWSEEDDSRRVVRGGAWGDLHGFAACAYRSSYNPGARYNGIGFRCART